MREADGSDEPETSADTTGERVVSAALREFPVASPPIEGGEFSAHVGREADVAGQFSFKSAVRVDGALSGGIVTSDAIIVGPTARVDAAIVCTTLVAHGEISGSIRASVAIELRASARVRAEVHTPSLTIEQGAIFEGHAYVTRRDRSRVVTLLHAAALRSARLLRAMRLRATRRVR